MKLYEDGYGRFYADPDRAYAEWCLANNWLDRDGSRAAIGDFSAGIYVCGEGLFDDEWEAWIKLQQGQ